MAEVGGLLVVAKCNVIKYTSLLFVRHKRHREAGGDPLSCAARFIATYLESSRATTSSDSRVCSLRASPAPTSCSMTDTFTNPFQ